MTRDRLWDIGFAVFFLIVSALLLTPLFDPAKDITSSVPALITFLVSSATFYLTVFHPYTVRPRLECSIDKPRKSEPADSEAKSGVKASTFLRLKVTNHGVTTAKQCVGRLLEVQDKDRNLLDIDTLYLYWERQSDPDAFEPVNIQGYGDSFYLDVIQAAESTKSLVLRVVIPIGHRLVKSDPFSDRGELPQGIYYLRIGIWADGAYIKPRWFKVQWENNNDPLMEKA